MARRITIIDGHPDPGDSFCHALARAYRDGAEAAGHAVRVLEVARIDVPFLRSREEWQGEAPPAIRACQEAIGWADHLVIVFPLWLGSMPALLKAFLEQTFRPGFAIKPDAVSLRPGLLTGKSARIVVTMGMPALLYRLYFRAHGLKSLSRNILRFAGTAPVRATLIGSVEAGGTSARTEWLRKIHSLGAAGR